MQAQQLLLPNRQFSESMATYDFAALDIDHVAILDSVPVGTPQIAGVPENLHFWLPKNKNVTTTGNLRR